MICECLQLLRLWPLAVGMRVDPWLPRLGFMSSVRLAWPHGRRLFRAGRRASKTLPAVVAVVTVVAAAVAATLLVGG